MSEMNVFFEDINHCFHSSKTLKKKKKNKKVSQY